MEFLNQTYIALRGPTGAPQSPVDTISRLSDRLSPSTLLADRRAAVLALKGLSRDWRAEIGERALTGLLDVLQNDADVDAEIGKAVLETLNILCEVEEHSAAQDRELGFNHTDRVLADEKAAQKLFALLADHSFYLRFATLQFLGTLLQNRRQALQGYFLKTQSGPTNVIAVLEDKREIIRNGGNIVSQPSIRLRNLIDHAFIIAEAIFTLQSLITQSPDIQKILTFEGAFEKLFNIIIAEGGVDGGVAVRDALTCVDGLLRFNQSNQVLLSCHG